MSVGVHSGEFHFFLVGGSHRELIVTGPAASTVVTMEGTADAGQIVVSPATAAGLRPGVVGEAKGPGFLLRRAPDVPADSVRALRAGRPAAPTSWPGSRWRCARWSGPATRSPSTAGHGGLHPLRRHRRTWSTSSGPAAAADQLDELGAGVQEAADRHQVDLPGHRRRPRRREDHPHRGRPVDAGGRRAPHAAHPARGHGRRRQAPGTHRGQPGGGLRRRDRSPLPSDVHGHGRRRQPGRPADGQGGARPAGGGPRRAQPRSRTSVRGRGARAVPGQGEGQAGPSVPGGRGAGGAGGGPRRALSVRGPRGGARRTGPVGGRGGGGLGHGWSRSSANRGWASPGWSQEVRDRLHGTAAAGRRRARSTTSSTPYLVVRRAARAARSPVPGVRSRTRRAVSATVAERAPAVLPWSPLVAQAVGLPVPDTDETRELDEEYRRPRLARAVLDLLAGVLPPRGLLCIDDAHFMDEASADLMAHLAEAAPASSWLTVVSRRSVDTGFVAPESSVSRLELGPLPAGDALTLARMVAGRRRADLTPARCRRRPRRREPALPPRAGGGRTRRW